MLLYVYSISFCRWITFKLVLNWCICLYRIQNANKNTLPEDKDVQKGNENIMEPKSSDSTNKNTPIKK